MIKLGFDIDISICYYFSMMPIPSEVGYYPLNQVVEWSDFKIF